MTNYKPALFQAIAEQVASKCPEQYLFASNNSITVMFSDERIENEISSALDALKDGINVIGTEYHLLKDAQNCQFDDGVSGLIDVDGVLVELVVRKLNDSGWRVLFSRVDARKLYLDLSDRIVKLEVAVASATSV